MVLKPVNPEKIIDQEEEDFEDQDDIEEQPMEEPEKIKKAVGRPSKQNQDQKPEDDKPQLTKEEVIDMIDGHLNRAYQLLQALR